MNRPTRATKARSTKAPPFVVVTRRCPMCRVSAEHFGDHAGVPDQIQCSQCGHEWMGEVQWHERTR